MAHIFRWLMRLFLVLAVLAGCIIVVIYNLAARSLPDYDAAFVVEDIESPVEIVRDNANIPHIFAETDPDVLFGLGFAHAQDRLWQMTLMRRTAQGRLSELLGEPTVKTDELMRRFGLYRAAESSVEVQDPQVMEALKAYSAGVNAWIETVNSEALGRGAPEFFMFSPEIAPWRPADSIVLMKLMAYQLSSHLQAEVRRAKALLVLPPERVRDLLPEAPGSGLVELPDYSSLFPEGYDFAWSETWQRPDLLPIQPLELAGASNAWAAAPIRSASGGTLLANDPHLGFTAPTIWYLARLELESGGVIGATVPGIPLVVAGRSQRIGWAVTASYVDDQDIFLEELNPANPQEYRTPNGWAAFDTERSIIRIKNAPPLTITLRSTENGPVLPGSHFDLEDVTPPRHVAALAWSALEGEDTSLTSAFRLMTSQSVAEASDALEGFVAPSLNVTLVDPDSIAMQVAGALPNRQSDNTHRGRIPSYGWQEENRWQGYKPFTANPRFVDPESGLLGNTNNKTVNKPFPNHLSYDWGDTQRILRWRKLMEDREVHTRESFIDAQLDSVSVTARNLLPLIARDLWFTGEAAQPGTPEAQRKRALDLLASWNGEMSEHLPEPLIYSAWLRHLQDKLIRDELGPFAGEFTHADPIFIERVFRDIAGASVWCDIRQSTARESCVDVSRIALDEALLWIAQEYGSALESLRWGDAHTAEHKHQVLGREPILKWLVNIRQSTSGGDHTLMRGKTSGEDPRPFTNVHGAGYRGVYDFADPDSSLFILSTGQSGHPLSRYYDDLGVLWRRGEYVRMSLDPNLARAAAVGVTTLSPE